MGGGRMNHRIWMDASGKQTGRIEHDVHVRPRSQDLDKYQGRMSSKA